MNNELQIFENETFGSVRTIEEDGKILFCGKDVAKSLGYSNTKDAILRHCRGVVKRDLIDSLGRKQKTNFITEGDIYRLATKSELPSAEKFESWIFDEVIPSIRKAGKYDVRDNINSKTLAIAQALIYANEMLEEQNKKIIIMQPKADYFDELIDKQLNLSIRETAKELCVKEKYFINFLLENEYIFRDKNNKIQPYSKYVGNLFVLKECYSNNTKWTGTQTLITVKGRDVFRQAIKNKNRLICCLDGDL